MHHVPRQDKKLYDLLLQVDRDLAAAARAAACPRCGGRLDSARYRRKPRGAPPAVMADPEQSLRWSLCCDACKHRVAPPSVRFFGRRVYFAPCFLLISALRGKLTVRRLAQLRARYGVDRRTLRRWQQWWRQVFPATAFWRLQRGRVLPPVDEAALPGSLLERFDGALLAALRFLLPLTTAVQVEQ